MKITVHTVTYNEELIMQFMIDHYRSRFPNCTIVVYDNQSTDRTVEIAKANHCEMRYYNSNNQVNDQMLWDTKNTCWKTAQTDWCLVCDTDELLDINAQDLKNEEAAGVTKIKCEAWHMVNMEDTLDIRSIKHGCRNPRDTVYDKDLLFNKKFVDINYINNDCHFTNSRGKIKNSKPYRMYHYKYVNPDVFVAKQKTSASRLSDINRKNGWGAQCLRDEGSLRLEFQQARDAAVKIL
jgi:glycosyltransferase involved in cell wall biosynthesis